MIRLRALLVFSWILALLTVIALWWFVSADTVNSMFDAAESIGAATGRGLASLVGIDPTIGEMLAIDRMHADRTIVVGCFMLVWLAILTYMFCAPVIRTVGNALTTILVVHLILGVLWFALTPIMGGWYALHTMLLRGAFRALGLYKTETFLLLIFHVQSLFILGEALLIWRTFVSSRFDRAHH